MLATTERYENTQRVSAAFYGAELLQNSQNAHAVYRLESSAPEHQNCTLKQWRKGV